MLTGVRFAGRMRAPRKITEALETGPLVCLTAALAVREISSHSLLVEVSPMAALRQLFGGHASGLVAKVQRCWTAGLSAGADDVGL